MQAPQGELGPSGPFSGQRHTLKDSLVSAHGSDSSYRARVLLGWFLQIRNCSFSAVLRNKTVMLSAKLPSWGAVTPCYQLCTHLGCLGGGEHGWAVLGVSCGDVFAPNTREGAKGVEAVR